MAQNFDYISMLNMPTAELSPLTATDGDFQNDLDLWLTADFNFDASGSDFGERTKGFMAGAETTSPLSASSDSTFTQSPAQQQLLQNPMAFAQPLSSAPTGYAQTATGGPPSYAAAALDMFATPSGAGALTLQQVLAAAAAINAAPPLAGALPAAAEQAAAFPPAAAASTPSPAFLPQSSASSAEKPLGEREKTLEEIDKRRRNTAASARFRLKKKQREQALEQTARDMSDKAAKLELRVKEYEMELKWLRQLVTDRDGKKRLRDFYDESGLSFTEGTMAAGCGIENPSADFTLAAAAFAGALASGGDGGASFAEADAKRRRAA